MCGFVVYFALLCAAISLAPNWLGQIWYGGTFGIQVITVTAYIKYKDADNCCIFFIRAFSIFLYVASLGTAIAAAATDFFKDKATLYVVMMIANVVTVVLGKNCLCFFQE
jgi:hypothetical protein